LPNILWFDEIDTSSLSKVGGKGANLGEMTKANFPIPPGFCVTAQGYFDFLEKAGIRKKIEEELEGLNTDDTRKLNAASRAVKKIIVSAKIPEDLKKQIKEAYKKIGTSEFVAVRSSATAEDLPDASFAGQQATFLNVKGENEVVDAVQKCWASLFEPRAIFYRVEKKFDHMKIGLSAIVQKMVQSDVSGLLKKILKSKKKKLLSKIGKLLKLKMVIST